MATADQPLGSREFSEAMENTLSRREFYDVILPQLATKADLADLEIKLIGEMGKHLRWMVASQFLGMTALAAFVTAAVAVLKFLG